MAYDKLYSFEEAFSSRSGHCRLKCDCGKTYFDNYNEGYSWEEGELESLQAGEGIPVDGSISGIEFEGRYYAMNCDCWKPRATRIMQFLDAHSHSIVEYFKLEKKRKQDIANESPSLE